MTRRGIKKADFLRDVHCEKPLTVHGVHKKKDLMENFLILTSIGKAAENGCLASEAFTYQGVKYEKLLLWDQFDNLISE